MTQLFTPIATSNKGIDDFEQAYSPYLQGDQPNSLARNLTNREAGLITLLAQCIPEMDVKAGAILAFQLGMNTTGYEVSRLTQQVSRNNQDLAALTSVIGSLGDMLMPTNRLLKINLARNDVDVLRELNVEIPEGYWFESEGAWRSDSGKVGQDWAEISAIEGRTLLANVQRALDTKKRESADLLDRYQLSVNRYREFTTAIANLQKSWFDAFNRMLGNM